MGNGIGKGARLSAEVYRDIYVSLKGFRRNRTGELIIPFASEFDYETLLSEILAILDPVIDEGLEEFIDRIHHDYLKWYGKQRMDVLRIRPRLDERPNSKQLLTLLKHFVYRRTYSNFRRGEVS